MKEIRFSVAVLVIVIGLFLSPSSRAATNHWDANVAAGLTLTRGNSETLLTTLTFKAMRKATNNEILLGATGSYGEATREETVVRNGVAEKEDVTKTTAANAAAYGQFNHLITQRFYGGGRLDFVHDAIADLKYRVTVSPLAGYYVLKDPKMKLSFEIGPSGVFERQGRENNQYAALRVGDRFEYKFTPKSRVWQSFDYIPQVDRWGNYLLVAEIGGEAAFTDKFSLRAVLQDTYDNEPADNRKKNDIKLITSVVYKF
jgi:putative salt-induced outer membrane protein YdiY